MRKDDDVITDFFYLLVIFLFWLFILVTYKNKTVLLALRLICCSPLKEKY